MNIPIPDVVPSLKITFSGLFFFQPSPVMVGLWQPGFPTLWQPRLDEASGKSFDARGPRGLEAVGSFARLKHDRITLYMYLYIYIVMYIT